MFLYQMVQNGFMNDNSSLTNLYLNGGIVNLNDSEIKEKYKNTLVNEYVLADYRSTDAHKSVTIEILQARVVFLKLI